MTFQDSVTGAARNTEKDVKNSPEYEVGTSETTASISEPAAPSAEMVIDATEFSADSEENKLSNPSTSQRPATVPVAGPLVFPYEVEIDVSAPIAVLGGRADVRGRFRHFHAQAVTLTPGVMRAFNLGVVLFDSGGKTRLFEDRLIVTPSTVEPGTWAAVTVAIPDHVIDPQKDYQIEIDLLKEGEYWFASYGQTPLKSQISFADSQRSKGLGLFTTSVSGASLAPARSPFGDRPTLTAAAPRARTGGATSDLQIAFDVSDLIQYFHNARLPTGIQRVQIAIITNLILSSSNDFDLKVCCFTRETDGWVDLPLYFVVQICSLSLTDGDTQAPEWKRALEELQMFLDQAKPLVFKRGAYLINLGTSWWLQNYFLQVRAAKARFGIRYVPYVHDCIPIMAPEHCVENLTRDFITWTLGAFHHCDHILVNSEATARDVKAVAKRLGHAIEEPEIVKLDADFRIATSMLRPEADGQENSEVLARNDLSPKEFVLFVSTIESRKNHLMAFSAWLTMAKKYGIARVPKLVCVGNRGWLNDAIYAKLAASRILQEKVTLLSKISDLDLELLYRSSLFTLYPSSYEGWGLPITESLCYGKVPLLANSSSLPEAGGEFAEYFDLSNEAELLAALERLMFDSSYREQKENLIAQKFRPRRWIEIANQIVKLTQDWAKTDTEVGPAKKVIADRGLWPFPVELGRYYGFTENLQTRIWAGMVSGEMYRQGSGWWWPEPWGCWTKATVARIALVAPLPPGRPAMLYLGIKGVQGTRSMATVNLVDVGKRTVALNADEERWVAFQISPAVLNSLPRLSDGVLIEVRLSSDRSADFRATTGGADRRVASLGSLGFMVCEKDDIVARLGLIEQALVLHDLAGFQGTGAEYDEVGEEG